MKKLAKVHDTRGILTLYPQYLEAGKAVIVYIAKVIGKEPQLENLERYGNIYSFFSPLSLHLCITRGKYSDT